MRTRYAKRLYRELSGVLERLRTSDPRGGEGAEPAIDLDSMDGVRAALDRDVAVATRSLLVTRRRQIAQALDRLAHGEYGACEECGRRIGAARLAAMPEVTTCVRCQGRREPRAQGDAARAVAAPISRA